MEARIAKSKVRHGMIATARGGPGSLMQIDPKLVKRLDELRLLLDTAPGRREVRVELGARLALMCELGIAEVGRQMELEGDLFDASVVAKLNTWMNSLLKLLDKWPSPVDEAIHVEEMAKIDRAFADPEETDE